MLVDPAVVLIPHKNLIRASPEMLTLLTLISYLEKVPLSSFDSLQCWTMGIHNSSPSSKVVYMCALTKSFMVNNARLL